MKTALTGIYEAIPATLGEGAQGQVHLDANQNVMVVLGGAGAAQTLPTGAATAANQPGFPTGASRIVSAAATTNATVAKVSAGKLFNACGYNAATSLRYLKVYNKASSPTVGTDVPILTLALPPSSAFAFDFAGLSFAAGIGYSLNTGNADNDTGALTAADVVGLNVVYS